MSSFQIIVGDPPFDWLELVPAIAGGIIGALAAGVPAYLLAIRATNESLKKERDIKYSSDRSRANRIFILFEDVLNDLLNTLLQIEEMISDLKLSRDVGPYQLQRRIRPLANLDFISYVDANADDVSILIENGNIKLAGEIRLSFKRHNSILNSLRLYRTIKEKNHDFLMEIESHSIAADGKVTTKLPKNMLPRLQLLEAQMEQIIRPTLLWLRENVDDMLNLADKIGPALKECLHDGKPFLAYDPADTEIQKSKVVQSRNNIEDI